MTYGECKEICMQKVFSAGHNGIDTDDATRDYLAAVPFAVNEAINRIVSARPLRKSVEFDVDKSDKPTGINIKEICKDFKNTGNLEVYYLDENDVPRKIPYVKIVAGDYVVLPASDEDYSAILYYDANPLHIAKNEKEDTKLPLEEDACALIPLYVASELYKDDDIAISTYYMNEFEVGLAALKPHDQGILSAEFYSESGW